MPTTKRTTVLDAKRVGEFLQIAASPGYYDPTGRARSKNSKRSSPISRNNGAFRWFLIRFEPLRDERRKIVR